MREEAGQGAEREEAEPQVPGEGLPSSLVRGCTDLCQGTCGVLGGLTAVGYSS